MAIDPTKSGSVNPTGGARVDQTGANHPAVPAGQARQTTPPGSAPQGDQVQLSPEALAASNAEGTRSASGLSRDRLQEILQRLTSGYYNSPQVTAHVARKVAGELGGTSGST
ncbi:MAG TPA: hypothetical protein VMG41_09885 [Gemmatimonadales bacterium]|nr:hypothetical protein [Gemmatimonadales bacterium]